MTDPSAGRPRRGTAPLKRFIHYVLYVLILTDEKKLRFDGEVVVYSARYHVIRVLRDSLADVGGIIIALAVTLVANGPLEWPAFLAALFFQVRLFNAFVSWSVTRVLVTNRRLVEISGFFQLTVKILPNSKLTDFKLHQPFLGKVLNYGTLIVESAGQVQALERLDYVRRPLEVFNKLGSLAVR